ncbi:amino acid adenylation domain-containing protein [Chitinophaga nivalis]|uniref:Amino acid adenylation domain-containing protein n=1 Tax=Chitinophaga nivalis TaxID=2991709 RepID=A0ABT3IK91_9BACT|nr:amino acid adenylation domain-containing protein [Chitinophaga nivalis]MCW3466084.1 amino acid adenylation domain-containing protein [Chitinophaga nivalis]MCW3484225.1 amino acid adenylation domain-containing protein [Chitinophaga nivalis]
MSFQHELINSLRTHGESIVLEYDGQQISGNELLQRADAITQHLLQEALPPETFVGVRLQNRVDLITAFIGIANARCVFVPIDGHLPEERLKAMHEELALRYVITSGTDMLPQEDELQYFYLEDISLPASENNGYPAYEAEDSLYVYFTSGSTGKPKGIIGKNSSLLQFLQWEKETFHIGPGDRISQFISPYFDAFLRDVFLPLLSGATLCIPPSDKAFFVPENISAWISGQRITLIHCVPSVFRSINHDDITATDYPALKYVLLSGEKIVPKALLPWYACFGERVQLVNLYGPTETTMVRSCYLLRPADAATDRVPVGKPISDTQLLILDKNGKPCNTLVPGELYIVTDYMTKGYLNNAALTAEKFITLSTGEYAGKSAFRTGDRARKLTDGNIDLLGREDRQIKLSGIRIELDEIEQVLAGSGLIRQAVVIKQEAASGDESLAAFYISKDEQPEEQTAIQQYLRERLPEYMIPGLLCAVKEFPLLSNGKINYKELVNAVEKRPVVLPENDTEARLLQIWKTLLGDIAISTADRFNLVGGNSISMMRLLSLIYKAFNVRMTLADLFAHMTIRQQAAFIQPVAQDTTLDIPHAPEQPYYHTSAAQERVYYNFELDKERISYNLPMVWEIATEIENDRILHVFQQLTARHESLRTRFDVEDGQVVQYVLDQVTLEPELLYVAEADSDETIRQFVRPFDLNKAPLFRIGIILTDHGRKILVTDFHHSICDGMSQRILMADFSTLFYGQTLAPLQWQYRDYAEWEYRYKKTADYLQHRQFWLGSFEKGVPELQLPVSNANTEDLSEIGGHTAFEISTEVLQPLLDHLRAENISTVSGLFAVYYLFLSQLTGQEEMVIGMAASGRTQHELEGMVGMFVKTLPICFRSTAATSFDVMVKALHQQLIQAGSHQLYDLQDMMTELNKKRTVKLSRLYSAGFVSLDFEDEQVPDDKNDFRHYAFEKTGAKNPLTLYLREHGSTFYFRLSYAHAYFTAADIDLLITQFKVLAERIAANVHARIDDMIGDAGNAAPVVESDIDFNF